MANLDARLSKLEAAARPRQAVQELPTDDEIIARLFTPDELAAIAAGGPLSVPTCSPPAPLDPGALAGLRADLGVKPFAILFPELAEVPA